MRDEIQILQDLLDKYKVTRPVPAGIQREIYAHKRRNFVAIMKKLGRYTPLLGAFLFVYFLVRRLGFIATLKQCGVILVTASVLTVAGISAGTYMIIKHAADKAPSTIDLQNDKDESVNRNSLVKHGQEAPGQAIEMKETPPPLREVKNVIMFQPFEGVGISAGEAARVSAAVQDELVRLRGQNNIISAVSGTTDATKRLLLVGTVRRMGANYAVTAKIIDRVTGRIHYAATEEAVAETLARVSKKIAYDISKNIE
ncbi:MAG TPA: hypothetical protein PK875_10315 [Spirochaetota bacterium]|nr:hypothetical protein [Spirochaetota bacterium]